MIPIENVTPLNMNYKQSLEKLAGMTTSEAEGFPETSRIDASFRTFFPVAETWRRVWWGGGEKFFADQDF